MFSNKKEIFSIRKTVLGVGSVLLGVMLTTQVASAEETSAVTPQATSSTVVTATSPTTGTVKGLAAVTAPEVTTTSSTLSPAISLAVSTTPSVTETVIKSPIRYVADATQAVGYRQVQTQGIDGKLITTNTGTLDANGNPVITVQRIEPTETVIVLGTKPTTTVTNVIPATTEYSIDVTKPVGTDVIIPAVDGQTTTTTTNKIQTETTAPVSPAVNSEGYKWIDTSFYHIDTTQVLPSDRIAIDKLFVPVPKLTSDFNTTESTVREYAQYAENYMYDYITVTNPDGTTTQKQVIRPVTSEMLDPNNAQLRTVTGLTDNNVFYSRLLDASKEDIWNTSAQDYGMEMVPEDLTTSADDFLRYNSSNIINDAFYADIKADYLRAQLAYNQLVAMGTLTSAQQADYDLMTRQFDSLTRRYNSYRDSIKIDIDYSHTTMPDAQKADFESRLQVLPSEVQRIIASLVIYDGEIPGMGTGTLGLSNSADQSIALKYEASNTDLIATVLHEMTHIIDFKSGLYTEKTDRNTDNTLDTVMAFSDTAEFLDVYHTYFDRTDVWSYYRDNSEEAFAEGLSEYMMHKLFGTPYATYLTNPYSSPIDAYDPGNGTGYSPFAAAEYYFADLYNKLFGYPRTATVVAYQTTTTTTAPVNGKVIYGALPTETTTTTTYKTVYVGDTNMAYDPTGQTNVVKPGVEGTQTVRTTYALDTNNQLVGTDTIISSSPAQDQVITKGIQPTVVDKQVAMTVIYQEVKDGSLGDWQIKVLDVGQDGLVRTTTTYTIDATTGVITPSTTETTVTAMRPMIVQYQAGTAQVTPVAYQKRYVLDPNLPSGSQVVVTPGQDGTSTVTVHSYDFVQDGANSRFANIVYSSPVVVAAQDRVIAVGAGTQVQDKQVAKTVIYQEVTDNSLADWQVEIADAGQDGLNRTTTTFTVDPVTGAVTPSIVETTVTAMRPMIVRYKVGSTQTTTVPFATEYVADNSIPFGTEKVVTEGQNGLITKSVAAYNFVQDGANSRFENIQYNEVTNPQVINKVISKGTQTVVSDQAQTKTVVYQEVTDNSLAEWEVKVVSQGQDGLTRTTTTYTVNPVTGEVTPSVAETVVTAMTPMVVQYRMGSDKVTNIAYKTRYVADTSLARGQQQVTSPGQNGTSTISVQSFDFIQDGANSRFENIVYASPVVAAAQDQVIAVGAQSDISDSVEAKTIVYKEIMDNSLADWEVKVLDAGQDGIVRTTTSYTIDPVAGALSSTTSETTLSKVRPMLVGYKVGASKTGELAFNTQYVEDSTLAEGQEKVLVSGSLGTTLATVKSFNFIEDGANSRFENIVYNDPTIVIAAVDQVIARGTKEVPVVTLEPEVTRPVEGKPAPTVKAVGIKAPVQTSAKVEAVQAPKESLPTTGDNQNLLVTLMSSALVIGLGLGLKKKEEK
ncbi:G5 domain-containing protein [Streptococcus bovimastitidis]|uniref:G5 domain-containing protein n=1 Tax=Streptococcus bovimastitidis TaxID=1856638 RepID=UPI0009F31849|nr:G5 domain-containing protein [Streptococcus bovimastitidis]